MKWRINHVILFIVFSIIPGLMGLFQSICIGYVRDGHPTQYTY